MAWRLGLEGRKRGNAWVRYGLGIENLKRAFWGGGADADDDDVFSSDEINSPDGSLERHHDKGRDYTYKDVRRSLMN